MLQQNSISFKKPLNCSATQKLEQLWIIYTSRVHTALFLAALLLAVVCSAQPRLLVCRQLCCCLLATVPSACRAKAARKAREAGQDEKRRRMREDLEKREGAWQSARNEEQKARNKLQVSWTRSKVPRTHLAQVCAQGFLFWQSTYLALLCGAASCCALL